MQLSIPLLLLVTAQTLSLFANASVAYTAGSANGRIYQLNLTNGSPTSLTLIGGQVPVTTSLADLNTLYVTTAVTGLVYRLNVSSGNLTQIASIGGYLQGMECNDTTTGYIASSTTNTIYRINLQTGAYSGVVSIPSSPGLFGVGMDFSLETPTVLYTAGVTDNKVYRVDVVNGTYSVVTPTAIAGAGLSGIALSDCNTAYLVGQTDNNVYRVNLTNGNVTLVTPTAISGAQLAGIALSDSNTAYVTGYNSNKIYRVNLTTGSFTTVTPSAIAGASLSDMDLVLQIGTAGLSGNNLTFANYLNNNAPVFTVPLLALQPNIPSSLESAIPTRNAIFTFVSQTTQTAFGQILYDHLGQKRWSKVWPNPQNRSQTGTSTVQWEPSSSQFLVDNSEEANSSQNASDSKESLNHNLGKRSMKYSPWLGILGEYTKEKSQHQTPGFESGSGGFVAGFDYQQEDQCLPLAGAAIAYAYTHVHEKQGAGHANINQGALTAYGAWDARNWYVDLGLWLGLYHANNVRNVALFGIPAGAATSSTNGWQLTPHLEFGYEHNMDWLRIEPFEMIDWVACWENGFEEHGVGRLNMGQRGRFCSLLRNELGFRFQETLAYDWGSLTLREKSSYVYQKTFHTGVISAYLVGSAGSFTVTTLTGAQNLGVCEFEALFVPENQNYPYATLSYQGEFGSRYQSHQGMASLGLDF